MIWLTFTLLRRNIGKYIFVILGIAACVSVLVISSAGNSVLWRESRYPLRFMLGGDIIIVNRNLEFIISKYGNLTMDFNAPQQLGLNTYIAREEVSASLKERFPQLEITSTVLVPGALILDGGRPINISLVGRVDKTGYDGIRPIIAESEWQNWQNQEDAILLFPGELDRMISAAISDEGLVTDIPQARFSEGRVTVDMSDLRGARQVFRSISYFSDEVPALANMGVPWVRGDNTAVVGEWANWADWLSLSMPADPLGYELYTEELTAFLDEHHPELGTYTLDELMQMLSTGFVRLEVFAERYAPLLLFVATLTLAVTQLSLINSRRREYAVYQLLGLDRRRRLLFFVLENLIILALGIVLGLLMSYAFCMMFFRGFIVDGTLVLRFALLALPVSLLIFSRTDAINPTEVMRAR